MTKGEAGKIYRSIFRKEIPAIVRERFDRSSLQIIKNVPEQELARYRKIIDTVSDLAAVEYASRILGKNPMLLKKFQVMIYLGECIPDNYNIFINEKRNLMKTLLIFASVPFNSVYKFFKGFLILKLKIR